MSKTCFACDALKPLDDFYKHSRMRDGHLNKCIQCVRDYTNERRITSGEREKVLASDKKRSKTERRKKNVLEYQRCSRKRRPEAARAHNAVSNAIRDGKLKRLPCSVCGDKNSQAHHLDYTRPLYVQWLCFKHHRTRHGHLVTN